uniref:Uncharacterized protein n=1 Tax=Arundo donax TaxID=35708 RepID=A0A0A9B547_ARUDO
MWRREGRHAAQGRGVRQPA